jgi:hypothetical protein
MNYAQLKKIEWFSPSITDAFMRLIGVEMVAVDKGIVNDLFPKADNFGVLPEQPRKVRLFELTLTRKKTGKCIVLDFCYYETANRQTPSFYDVLTNIPKSELECFENWCWSFGCNSNLISNLNIYNHQAIVAKAVVDFFSKKELEQLEKVQ